MINNLEGMSKKELIEVIEIQQQNDIEREAEINRLKAERDELDKLRKCGVQAVDLLIRHFSDTLEGMEQLRKELQK
ncbi:MAG: hypothetical protein ACPHUL_00130 [Marinomonas gallaica]